MGKALPGPRLPWNGGKSLAGTAGFLVGGCLATWLSMFVSCSQEEGWRLPALYAIFAAAGVESLPLGEWDNLAVPLVAWCVFKLTMG